MRRSRSGRNRVSRCSTCTPDGLRCCLRLVSRTKSGCIDSHAASVAVLQPIPSHGAKLLSPAAAKSGLGANGHLEYFFADVVEVGAVDHYQYCCYGFLLHKVPIVYS